MAIHRPCRGDAIVALFALSLGVQIVGTGEQEVLAKRMAAGMVTMTVPVSVTPGARVGTARLPVRSWSPVPFTVLSER